jgi:hypothetical protein
MKFVGRTVHGVLALWHALAASQNAFEILVATEAAPGLKPFASKNLPLVEKVIGPLRLPRGSACALLAGASGLELVAALGFIRGALAGKRSEPAFAASLLLFGSFFLTDDALDDYDLGAKHRAIFTLIVAAYSASGETSG